LLSIAEAEPSCPGGTTGPNLISGAVALEAGARRRWGNKWRGRRIPTCVLLRGPSNKVNVVQKDGTTVSESAQDLLNLASTQVLSIAEGEPYCHSGACPR